MSLLRWCFKNYDDLLYFVVEVVSPDLWLSVRVKRRLSLLNYTATAQPPASMSHYNSISATKLKFLTPTNWNNVIDYLFCSNNTDKQPSSRVHCVTQSWEHENKKYFIQMKFHIASKAFTKKKKLPTANKVIFTN